MQLGERDLVVHLAQGRGIREEPFDAVGQARCMVHTAGTGGEPRAAPAPVTRVIPPNTTTVLEVAHPLTICGDTFGATPVSAPDADSG